MQKKVYYNMIKNDKALSLGICMYCHSNFAYSVEERGPKIWNCFWGLQISILQRSPCQFFFGPKNL